MLTSTAQTDSCREADVVMSSAKRRLCVVREDTRKKPLRKRAAEHERVGRYLTPE
jgi:hypothetical protein